LGTAEELATRVLKDTDWSVSEMSEIMVDTTEENLVYLKSPSTDLEVVRVLDQTDLTQGVDTKITILPKDSTVLAFYSSCTTKPHRF
jgi:hypothetical protein